MRISIVTRPCGTIKGVCVDSFLPGVTYDLPVGIAIALALRGAGVVIPPQQPRALPKRLPLALVSGNR